MTQKTLSLVLLCFLTILSAQAQTVTRRAVDMSVGPDGKARVLWSGSDNSAQLWTVNPDGVVESNYYFGPPERIWTLTALGVGPDSNSRVLWRNANASISLWTVNPQGQIASNYFFGPYAGFNATTALSVGADNTAHLIWPSVDNQTALWTLTPQGQLVGNYVYGPYSGWTGTSVSVGPDGNRRLLWDHTSGDINIWKVNPQGQILLDHRYGPFTDWTALRVVTAPDNTSRVLLRHTSGEYAIWRVDANNQYVDQIHFGPFVGWSIMALAFNPDGTLRVLWDDGAGQTRVWAVNGSWGVTDVVPFGPTSGAVGLAAPTSLATTAGSGSVSLTWGASAGAAGYAIHRSTAGGRGYVPIGSVSAPATAYTDRAVVGGVTYFYVVTAVRAGESALSNEAVATPRLAAPTGLTATAASATQINLAWTAPAGTVTGYKAERSPDGGTGWAQIATPPTNAYQDTGLSAGTRYYYRVKATNAAGDSDPSSVASAITVSAAPLSLSATPGDAQVTLSWASATGAVRYNLYRGTAAGGEGAAPYKTGLTGSTYTDAGLVNGTTYFYQVSAVNGGGESARSTEAGARPLPPVPAAPVLSGSVTGTTASLNWTAPANAATYSLFRSSNGGTSYTQIGSGLTATTYSDSGLASGATCRYYVVAANISGGSPNSNTLSLTAPDFSLSASPSSLSVAQGDSNTSTVSLSSLYGFTGAVSLTAPGLPAGVAALFSPTSLTGNSSSTLTVSVAKTVAPGPYTVTVTGTGSSGAPSHTATVALTVTASANGAPTALVAVSGARKVSLSWSGPSEAASYNVKRSTTSGGPYTTIANGFTGSSYVDVGVPIGTTYDYVVSANAPQGESGNSNEAKGTSTTGRIVRGITPLSQGALNNLSQVAGVVPDSPSDRGAIWYKGSISFINGSFLPKLINDAGQMVDQSGRTFWQNGMTADIGAPAAALNSRGQVAGSMPVTAGNGSQVSHAFLWSSDQAVQDLGTLPASSFAVLGQPPVATPVKSVAYGLNNLGQVVGHSYQYGGFPYYDHAFLWNGGMQDITGGHQISYAFAINAAGLIAGSASVNEQPAYPDGVSPPMHAFIWQVGGGMTDITPNALSGKAVAVNNKGQAVGTETVLLAGVNQDRAFLWDQTDGLLDLNDLIPPGSGWILQSATSINDKGEIMGTGTLNGQTQTYLLTFPEGSHPAWKGNKPKDCHCDEAHAKKARAGSKNDPVNLATGAEEYDEDPDIAVTNPVGPAVAFQRSFRSDQAVNGAASPGLSAGWTHNYDYTVQGPVQTGAWGPLTLISPNGAQETWAPVLGGNGQPTGDLKPEPGTPYLVRGVPDTTPGQWQSVTLTWGDRTQWQFTPSNGAYVLSQITNRTGQSVSLTWNAVRALTAVTETASNTTLLGLTYDADGKLASVTDAYGRKVLYTFGPADVGGPNPVSSLTSVSEMVPAGTAGAPMRWTYGYSGYNGQPLLHTISVPSATGASLSTATIRYAGDMVAAISDAHGVQHVYNYGPISAQVKILDSTGAVVSTRTQNFSPDQYDTGSADASGAKPTVEYGDPVNDSLPTHVVDKNGKESRIQYDAFGNVLQTKSARGVVTTFTYDYSAFPLGQIMSVKEGDKAPSTFTYDESTGLLNTVTGPAPGAIGGGATVTASYTYDGLGNLLSVTGPGNNASGNITTAFDYTTDTAYDADGHPIPAGQPAYTRPAALGQPLTVTNSVGKVTHLRYDARGNVTRAIDALGRETDTAYAFNDLPLTVTLPATGQTGPGRATQTNSYLYHIGNDPLLPYGALVGTTATDESGAPVRQVNLSYGVEGELLSRTGSTEPVSYAYDALYRLTDLTDGNSHTTHYSFDSVGNLSRVDYPGGDAMQFPLYDAEGNLLKRIDGRGVETDYVYNDPEGLLTDIQYPAAPNLNVHYAYDGYGRPAAMADGTGTQRVGTDALPGYDDLDDVLNVQTTYAGLPPQTLSYGYYPDGSRQSMTTPAGTFSYRYDGGGRLVGLTNPFSETSSWGYDDGSRLQAQQMGNGVVTSYAYNALDELMDLTNRKADTSLLSEFAVPSTGGYDGAGNRTALSALIPAAPGYGGQTSYGYDAKDQLLQEQSSRNGGYANAFTYDGAGNATTFRGQGPNAFTANNQHAGGGFTYDGDGNPVSYKGVALAFDPEDRLTGVGGALSAGYTGGGLRAWKQGAQGKTYFLYDGGTPVAELDGQGAVTAVNTVGANGLLSRHTTNGPGGGSAFYTFDPQGSAAQRLDGSGSVLASYVLDAYGGRVGTDSGADPFSGFGGQWGYYTDAETGLELLTHRYYDAATGRFITRDPIGYGGGINLYGYTGNNPISGIDPSGLSQDVGGGPGTLRLSWTAFIPVKYPGMGLLGDYRGYSANSNRYRLQQDIVINGLGGDRPGTVHLLPGKVGASHYSNGKYAGRSSNTTMHASVQYGQGCSSNILLDYDPVADIDIDADVAVAGILHQVAPTIHYNAQIRVDLLTGAVSVHGTSTAYPGFELWAYGRGGTRQIYGYNPLKHNQTPFWGLGVDTVDFYGDGRNISAQIK